MATPVSVAPATELVALPKFVAAVPGITDNTSTSPMLFVPAGSVGKDANDTGCVACQNVPVTGTESLVAIVTRWVPASRTPVPIEMAWPFICVWLVNVAIFQVPD